MYKISHWIYTILYIQRIWRIQIFCKSKQSKHLMYTISRWIYPILYIQHICRIQIFCKSRQSVHLMYTISRSIYAILDIQIFYNSRKSVHLMYTISCWIYAILYILCIRRIQIFCKPKQSEHLITKFLIEFMQFCTFNVSTEFNFLANPDNSYI